jgi:hypothetical protein
VQALAALVAAGYAFVITFVLVKVIDRVWGFGLSHEAENLGLDRAEHGEVGFDFAGAAGEEVAEVALPEPRPARVPPGLNGRYTVVVEGIDVPALREAWSALCQAGEAPPELRAVYPHVTTVEGNRFRFRGGERAKVRADMQRLFQARLGDAVRAHVEE